MVHKPVIQYVGQFYVYGSEAKELAPKHKQRQTRFAAPQTAVETQRKIYVDPVALVGIVVAVVMLISLVVGAIQIRTTWQEYDAIERYLVELKRENTLLEHNYRSNYDLEEIRTTALALGMVPATEAKTIAVRVTIPEPEKEPTRWDDFVWFMKGLFA